MIVIGVDPGIERMGYAILKADSRNLSLISSGLITTERNKKNPERLLQLFEDLGKLVIKYNPDAIATETLFFAKNTKTASKISEVRGVIQLISAKYKLEYLEFSPLQIKMAVTGYGRATKKQIEKAVKMILNLVQVEGTDDVIDAIAISICGANTTFYDRKVKK
ncbi:MAG: crossover junction endodeoxyribonuclease RuvC [Brevinematia bacterium]